MNAVLFRTLFKRVVKIALWLGLALTLIIGVFLFLLLDTQPAYQLHANKLDKNPPLTPEEIKEASAFVKRISKSVINARSSLDLYASQSEINNALALAHYSNSGLSGFVDTKPDEAQFSISLRLPYWGHRFYTNINAHLLSSQTGVRWKSIKIGNLSFSENTANTVFEKITHIAVGKKYGSNVIAGIHDLAIQNQTISFRFSPHNNLQKGFAKAAERLSTYSGKALHFDSLRVQHYLDFLVDISRQTTANDMSASRYLKALMIETRTQSASLKLAPEEENLAAMYALAVVVAPGTFRHFVSELKVHRLNATNVPKLTLSGREDLAKHFIYSMALHILSEKGLSFSLGEMKEIMDSDADGSGFSFADLAADRAGIYFSELAMSEHAIKVQAHIASQSANERDILPPVNDLPEGISEAEFQTEYGNTQSDAYRALLEMIDVRLRASSLSQAIHKAQEE